MTEVLQASLMDFPRFEHYWPEVERMLDEDRDLWQDYTSKELIFDGVREQEVFPWVIFDAKNIRLILLCAKTQCPNGEFRLNVFWMRGWGLKEALPVLDGAIDEFARMLGCASIEVSGRKGLEKVLAPLGAKFQCIILSRRVKQTTRN